MDVVENLRVPISVGALRKIEALPVDFEHELFAQYPAMKLGVTDAVEFYVDKLVALAQSAVKEHPDCKHWVITAPPFNTAPAAANLLCWRVYQELGQQMPADTDLSLLDLHLDVASMEIKNEADFKRYYEYSNNSVEERVKERSLLHGEADDIVRHQAELADRGVFVVNDIKVTGTQQDFMNKSFEQVGPRAVQWLYILEIDKQLGIENPQIENRINNSSIQTLEEFRALLCNDSTRYTARCITRLFTYEVEEFQSLLESLSADQLQTVLRYAVGEGRFQQGYFEDKFKLLETICQNTVTPEAARHKGDSETESEKVGICS